MMRLPSHRSGRSVLWLLGLSLVLGSVLTRNAAAEGLTVLRGARLIDGTGEPPRDNVDVVIHGSKILRVEESRVAVPEGATVVDCRGKTIVPGLISAHSHVGQVDGVSRVPENYNRDNVLRQLRQYEVYGVTTVVAMGTNQDIFYSIRDEMHAGKVPGADLFGADHGIGVRNGAPGGQALPASADLIDRPQTAEEARAAVRAAKARGTDLLKMWVDSSHGTVPKMTAEVYTAVIDEAHRQRLRVGAHIYNLQDAKALVEAGVDIIAHGVRDEPVDPEFVAAMKKRSVWYIATLSLDDAFFIYADGPAWMEEPFFQHSLQPDLKKQLFDPAWREKTLAGGTIARSRKAVEMNQRNLAVLHEAGVQIGFGTDSGAMPLRIPGIMEHRELQLMVEAGLSPLEAITIATGRSAELLHLHDRGTVTAGRLADLVILDADPSEDIDHTKAIHAVWHRGKKASGPVTEFTP